MPTLAPSTRLPTTPNLIPALDPSALTADPAAITQTENHAIAPTGPSVAALPDLTAGEAAAVPTGLPSPASKPTSPSAAGTRTDALRGLPLPEGRVDFDGAEARPAFDLDPAIRPRSEGERDSILRSFEVLSRVRAGMNVLFVMPMYNERKRLMPFDQKDNPLGEDSLRLKVKQLMALMQRNPLVHYRLLAVDDGTPGLDSRKAVEEIWGKIQSEYREIGQEIDASLVKVLEVTPEEKKSMKSKKGWATRKGLAAAFDEGWAHMIGFTDTDASTSLLLTPLLVDGIRQGYGAAIGSRNAKGGEKSGMGIKRVIASRLFLFSIAVLLLPLFRIRDTQRGFKLFAREVVPVFKKYAREPGLAIDTDLLLLTRMAGAKIKEVPIAWFDSAEASQVSVAADWKKMLFALCRQATNWLNPVKWLSIRYSFWRGTKP